MPGSSKMTCQHNISIGGKTGERAKVGKCALSPILGTSMLASWLHILLKTAQVWPLLPVSASTCLVWDTIICHLNCYWAACCSPMTPTVCFPHSRKKDPSAQVRHVPPLIRALLRYSISLRVRARVLTMPCKTLWDVSPCDHLGLTSSLSPAPNPFCSNHPGILKKNFFLIGV